MFKVFVSAVFSDAALIQLPDKCLDATSLVFSSRPVSMILNVQSGAGDLGCSDQ